MTDPTPSVRSILGTLRAMYPHTPFLALGQTVWWDEPLKASLRVLLDEADLGGHIVLGVHDTDYFAKVNSRQAGQSRFDLLPHNDGATKDLWSAAGEISRLFGSETFPTRHDLTRHGVSLTWLARHTGVDRTELVNAVTEAWGWRGLVYTGSRDLIVNDLRLTDLGSDLERMLMWGIDGTLESLDDPEQRTLAQGAADSITDECREFCHGNPDARLSDLYGHMFPKLFARLMGREPAHISVTHTVELLRFAPDTAGLPRFRLVDLFLRPDTRTAAVSAYNAAVSGGEIYSLDRFGLGSLPFDVVIPDRGRGTLRVTLRAVHIELRDPIRIPLARPIKSVHELADVLCSALGPKIVLVGKAVALISMLASEFIFVFHEEGSAYVTRTRRMNDHLAAHGLEVPVHPILRMHYRTWDALDGCETRIRLPEHLAATFGADLLSASQIARRWRTVLSAQKELLASSECLRKPRQIIAFLAGLQGVGWEEMLVRYDTAKARLRGIRAEGKVIQEEVDAGYKRLGAHKRSIVAAEAEMSRHFRSVTDWTDEAVAMRQAHQDTISELVIKRSDIVAQISRHKASRLSVERGSTASEARSEIGQIEAAVAMARMRLVQNAILTISGLTHTEHRPTAWWLPLVDPTGGWFRRVADTTDAYVQPLRSE